VLAQSGHLGVPQVGGRGVYFSDPNGHVLELMTAPQ
jgi:hypothetical protein